VTAPTPAARLSAFLAAQGAIGEARESPGRVVAIGWSTIELDRAAAELGAAFDILPDRFVDAGGSIALGARCRIGRGVLEGLSLVLLEPATEGLLAASLARVDEGPVAVWLTAAGLAPTTAPGQATSAAASARRGGPLGPERLLLGGPIHGPYRLLVEPAGTIRA
jgi:hypothetical protein